MIMPNHTTHLICRKVSAVQTVIGNNKIYDVALIGKAFIGYPRPSYLELSEARKQVSSIYRWGFFQMPLHIF